ncbi:hypothetical protein EON81_28035 [bacterium]|nr:MAG: hypothetical protein EON81_28035 [bacterium]
MFKFTIGDTAESGPKTTTAKLNQIVKMTVSPVNEPTDLIDETPKKKDPKKVAMLMRPAGRQADGAIIYLLQGVIQEIQSLSFFTGGFDASLDLAPKLPVEEISPGDTWKRTVGYAPQKLKGEAKKVAPQRLDYTYTYEGIVTRGATKVHRVTAKLSLKTDVAEFGRQMAGSQADAITKVPVTLDADIVYDLDLKTRHTIRAIATSRNSVQIYIKGFTAPIQESRAKGQTTLSLLSRTVGASAPKPKPRR